MRVKILALPFLVIAGLTAVFMLASSHLIQDKSEEVFSDRLHRTMSVLAIIWEEERTGLLRVALLLSKAVMVDPAGEPGPGRAEVGSASGAPGSPGAAGVPGTPGASPAAGQPSPSGAEAGMDGLGSPRLSALVEQIQALDGQAGIGQVELHLVSGLRLHGQGGPIERGPPLSVDDAHLNIARVSTVLDALGPGLVVTVPVRRGGTLVGRLSLRRALDDAWAARLARMLQADLALVSAGGLLSSSLTGAIRGQLHTALLAAPRSAHRLFPLTLAGQSYTAGCFEPARVPGEPEIRLVCTLSQQSLVTLRRETTRAVISLGLASLALTLILAAWFSERVLTRRLQRLADDAVGLAASRQATVTRPAVVSDELDDLTVVFAEMAASIARQESELVAQNLRLQRSESDLQERNEQLQDLCRYADNMRTYIENILASLEVGVITWNREWRTVTVNQAAQRLLAGTHREPHRLGLRDFLRPLAAENRQRVLAAIRRLLGHDEAVGFELSLPTAGARLASRSFLGRFTHLRDEDGKVSGRVLTLEDVTAQKLVEQQLFHADKLSSIGQLAASVAHEIKNPLASIKTLGQLLQEELPVDGTSREYTEVIVREVDRLNRVVEQLLRYARPEPGRFERSALRAMIDEVVALIDHEAGRRRVTVEIAVPPIELVVDAEKMRQVFLNLLINAMHAMPLNGGAIRVGAAVAAGGDWVTVTVADTGEGMPPEVRARLFEPFFTTRQRGTGLGLAIVKKIIEMHGGWIEVDSEVGRGCTFTIHLPVEMAAGAVRSE